MRRRIFMGVLVIVVLALAAVWPAAAQTNLLRDPGFETENYVFVSADPLDPFVTFNVPADWGGFFLTAPRDSSWQNVHPTGFPHTAGNRRSGFRSYHIARGGGTFTAIIYQQVSVTPGTSLQGGAWAFLETGQGLVRAGIDPNGSTNPFEADVVWGGFSGTIYAWNQVTVNATATGTTATLFLYATQTTPTDPNGVYWDDAFLNGVSGPPPGSGVSSPTGQFATTSVQVNVRSGPGTNFARIGRMNPGDVFAITGQQSGWYQINFNGQSGFVSASFVSVTNSAPAPSSPTISGPSYSANATVRVRSGPGTSFQILTRIPFRGVAQLVGRNSDASWLQVNFNGVIGWVSRQLGTITGDINALPVTG
ncbi:MAG: SH3 domain-containing protein [Chloroflexi bacterium]|nr:SH3 domain-containing protein [Chloroflexota bacterium]